MTALAGQYEFACQYHDRTESTNDDAFAWYRQHRNNVVVLTETQTAGRGRQGREWFSPYARNLYCSIGIELAVKERHLGLLSLYSGLNLCHSLHQLGYPAVRLKWPNDLLVNRNKLGGILVEVKPLGEKRHLAVIGFGINVLMTEEELAEIAQPSASLVQVDAAIPDRNKLLQQLLTSLLPALNNYAANHLDDLGEQFAAVDAFAGELVEITSANGQVRGLNHGINDQGQLRLQTDQGMETFSSGEISMRAGQA